MTVTLSASGVAVVAAIVLTGCSGKPGAPSADAAPTQALQSVYTDLAGGSCRKEADKSDPNETPYLVCPGVAGYSLIVRRVDSGRKSIDVVDPQGRAMPLQLQEFVTRHMSTLGEQVEWRVATRDGTQVPVALIVRVQAREDNKNPEQVTRTYAAVAKIAENQACVTDRFAEGSKPGAEVRSAADSAQKRPCTRPLPPMTADGTVIR